jgi:hypothetical protein
MGWEQVVEAGGQNVVVNGLLCTGKPNEIISDLATSYSSHGLNAPLPQPNLLSSRYFLYPFCAYLGYI